MEAIGNEEQLLEVYWLKAWQGMKAGSECVFMMLRAVERFYSLAEAKFKDNKYKVSMNSMEMTVNRLSEYHKYVASRNPKEFDMQYVNSF